MSADRTPHPFDLSLARGRDARARLLLALRRQLEPAVVKRLHALREAAPGPTVPAGDYEELATEESIQDLEAALAEREVQTLRGIAEALHRLDRGTYGVCADCHRAIPRERLEALPFAALCRSCQEEAESGRSVARQPGPLYVEEEEDEAA
jgi:RNA polymerase-binding protein DksA